MEILKVKVRPGLESCIDFGLKAGSMKLRTYAEVEISQYVYATLSGEKP